MIYSSANFSYGGTYSGYSPETITIYRNAFANIPLNIFEVEQNMLMATIPPDTCPGGDPATLTGYEFALMITQDNVNKCNQTVVITDEAPSVTEPGDLVFTLNPTQTASLYPGQSYHAVVLYQMSSSSLISPEVMKIIRVQVKDAPAFPTGVTPLI